MFYNTPHGLQLETDNGWTISISISLVGSSVGKAEEYCEIAVWPTTLSSQDNWVRWGDSNIEPPNFPIYDRVLGGVTYSELLRIINKLSYMNKKYVQPNRWIFKELGKDIIHF